MKKLFLLCGLTLIIGCSLDNFKASKMLEEVKAQLNSAQSVEQSSYKQSIGFYTQAKTLVQEMLTKHPKSKIAQNIAADQDIVGGITWAKLTQFIIPTREQLAVAEQSPIDLAAYMVSHYVPEGIERDQAWYDYAYSLGNLNMHKEALLALEYIQSAALKDAAFADLGALAAANRNFKVAEDLFGFTQTARSKAKLAGSIAAQFNLAGKAEEADTWFQTAYQALLEIETPMHRLLGYAQLLQSYKVANHPEKTASLATQALDFMDKQQGAWTVAIDAEHRAKNSMYLIQNGQAEKGDVVLNNALKKAREIDNTDQRYQTLAKIAHVLVQLKRLQPAHDLISDIHDDYWRAWAKRFLAAAYAVNNEADKAMQLARDISLPLQRASVLNMLARVVPAHAPALLKESLTIAQQPPAMWVRLGVLHAEERIFLLSDIAETYRQSDDPESAIKMLDHAQEVSIGIDVDLNRGRVLGRLAKVFLDLDKPGRASYLITQIPQANQQIAALNDFSEYLHTSQKVISAEQHKHLHDILMAWENKQAGTASSVDRQAEAG